MEQIPQYAESLGTIGLMMAIGFSVYKGWIVTGHEHRAVCDAQKLIVDKELARGDKLEAQLEKSIEAQRVANETIFRTASLVPDLVATIASMRKG